VSAEVELRMLEGSESTLSHGQRLTSSGTES